MSEAEQLAAYRLTATLHITPNYSFCVTIFIITSFRSHILSGVENLFSSSLRMNSLLCWRGREVAGLIPIADIWTCPGCELAVNIFPQCPWARYLTPNLFSGLWPLQRNVFVCTELRKHRANTPFICYFATSSIYDFSWILTAEIF